MKLDFHSATHTGLVRSENQDTVLADAEHKLFIVADGMGGHQGGGTASQMAVQIIKTSLRQKIKEDSASLLMDIEDAYETANRTIHSKGIQNPQLRGMGTTLCLLLVRNDGTIYIGNVGDSRLYMLKNKTLWQITEDHTSLTNQVKAGLIVGQKTPKPAFSEDHMLTKSVGFFAAVEPDIFKKTAHPGEVYLLCSDGLSGAVSDEEIQAALNAGTGKQCTQLLVDKALQRGGADNISVIVVEIS